MKAKQVIKNQVRFRGEFKKEFTDEFPGRDAAEFIAEQLRQKNFVVNSVEYEEPWFSVKVAFGEKEYALDVSHSAMEEEYWEISCPPLKRRDRRGGKITEAQRQALIQALTEILQGEKTITDVQWFGDYDDLLDDYAKKPLEKRFQIIHKYLGKVFLPCCLTGWVLVLIGGIRSGKESLLLRIGTILFLGPIAAWFGLFIVHTLAALIDDIKESFQKKTKKRWFRWMFALFLVCLLVGPIILGSLHHPAADKIFKVTEKGFYRLSVLTIYVIIGGGSCAMFVLSFSRIFIPRCRKKRREREWFYLVSSLLMFMGFTGFASVLFACLGMLQWIPKTVEVPLARLAGIDVNKKGNLFTASEIYSRVQVYDPNGDFLRGWSLKDTGGKMPKIRMNDADEVEAAIYLADRIDTFDEMGTLLRSRTYDNGDFWDSFEQKGEHVIDQARNCRYDAEGWVFPHIIRTGPEGKTKIGKNAFYLLPFQGPAQGFVLFAAGILLQNWADKKTKKKRS